MNQNKIVRGFLAFFSGAGTFIAAEIALWIVSSLVRLVGVIGEGPSHGDRSLLPYLIIGLVTSCASAGLAAFVSTAIYRGLGFTWGAVFGIVGAGIMVLSTIFSFSSAQAPWPYFLPLLPLAAAIGAGLWAERFFQAAAGASPVEDESGTTAALSQTLHDRLSALEARIMSLDGIPGRLDRLEGQLAAILTRPQPASAAAQKPESSAGHAVPVPPVAAPKTPAPPRAAAPIQEFSWESLLEGRWLFRVGMGVFILGVAFFLKYAFENQWIGPMGRVILGLATGISLMSLGDRQQKKGLALYGQTLTGGGAGILYLSLYAAFHFYGFLGQLPAFCMMALVTLATAVLALRYSSITIVVVAMLGGFVTPQLLSTGVVHEIPLFTYFALLNLGILAVSSFKNWRALNLLAFLLTEIWVQAYLSTSYRPEMMGVLFSFNTLYFLLFLIPNLRFNIFKQIPSEAADLALLLGNAGLYYATCYFRLMEGTRWEGWEAPLALLVGAVYFGSAQETYRRQSADKYLLLSEMGLAATFAVLAIPIALDWEWVTIGWAIEALVLLWIGLRLKDVHTRLAAMGLLAATGMRLLLFDQELRTAYAFLVNTRSLSFLATLGLMAAALRLAWSREPELAQEEKSFSGAIAVFWNILAIVWLCVETRDYLQYLYIPLHPDVSLHHYTMVAYSVLWTLYAFGAMGIGLLRRSKPLQYGAEVLFGFTVVKVILVDMGGLPLGPRVVSFLVLGGLILLISYFMQKQHNPLPHQGEREALGPNGQVPRGSSLGRTSPP